MKKAQQESAVLTAAYAIVYGDREKTYGHPSVNLERISSFWNTYLSDRLDASKQLTQEDVCYMMVLLKVARLCNNQNHADSLIDIAGYAALVERIHEDPVVGK